MTTLYIDRRGAALDADSGRVIVRVDGERTGTVPLKTLDRLVVSASATLSTKLLSALWDNGTALLVLSGYKKQPTVKIPGRSTEDATLRLAQFSLLQNERRREQASVALIRSKLRAEIATLERLIEQAGANRPLRSAIEQISRHVGKLETAKRTPRPWLRGIEGSAARAYFDGLATTFAGSLAFAGRNRRPPRDRVNACLSLGYSLLHNEAIRETAAVGLDPNFGFYHDPSPGRESLACDLAEPLRATLDLWVWTLFQKRVLRAESFARRGQACHLNKPARREFYHQYEQIADPWRQALAAASRAYAEGLVKGGDGLFDDQALPGPE